MSEYEQSDPLINEVFEMPTAKRFSLEDGSINRYDILRGSEKRPERFVEYPTPTDYHQEIRSNLISKHDILGKLEYSSVSGIDSFKIQYGAKPILYGAISRANGDYTYNDSNLFYDLGRLLRDFDNSLNGTKIIRFNGSIGSNVALVDFTAQHEKGLFLVPGVELYVEISPDESKNLDYYILKLQQEFNLRFSQTIETKFTEGFLVTGE
ncbi:MAG TPA: hypothetical protein VMV24_02470 [Candidatus Dormibacteraeota bacterium]|nr:hypothetical protein [Candidatus Dormibacteraeota bacterium]